MKKNVEKLEKSIFENLFLIRAINILKELKYIDETQSKKSIVKIKKITPSKKNA